MPAGFDAGAAFEAGLDRIAAARGPEAAAAVRRDRDRAAARGDASPVELPVALTWGWLLGRPHLSLRERALAMISVDVARGTRQALAEHLQLAGSAGVTGAELRELFLQLGPYAGYPAVNEAWPVLRSYLAARGATAAPGQPPAGNVAAGWLPSPATLGQISIAVPDAARAAAALGLLLGIGDWAVTRLDQDRAEFLAGGRPQAYELLRAVGRTPTGVRIELLEPRRGAIPAQLALLTKGPGIISVLTAEVGEDEAAATAGPAGTAVTQWRTGAGPAVRSYDLTAALGYRVDVVSPGLTAFDDALGTDERWKPGGSGGLIPLSDFGHFGVVMLDLEAATRAHAAAFGRQRWPVLNFSTGDDSLTGARYQGGPGTESYLSSVARVGGFAVELIQPVTGPSRYREGFLQPRGPGIQHLFFGPLPGAGQWDDLVEALRSAGYPLVTQAYGWNEAIEYAYVDTLSEVGFDIELVRMLRDEPLRISDRAALTFDHSPPPAQAPRAGR